jgi:hypothetical protein
MVAQLLSQIDKRQATRRGRRRAGSRSGQGNDLGSGWSLPLSPAGEAGVSAVTTGRGARGSAIGTNRIAVAASRFIRRCRLSRRQGGFAKVQILLSVQADAIARDRLPTDLTAGFNLSDLGSEVVQIFTFEDVSDTTVSLDGWSLRSVSLLSFHAL